MDHLQFDFADKTFSFSKDTRYSYKWLNDLFGNGLIGTPKEKLQYNLADYFVDAPPSLLRKICIILEHIQNHLEHLQNNTESEEEEVDGDLLYKTEHFLKFGPGYIKGFDVMFECTKCHAQTLDPSRERTKCSQEPIHHTLVTIHSGAKSCSYCGETFPMRVPSICPINDHNWM